MSTLHLLGIVLAVGNTAPSMIESSRMYSLNGAVLLPFFVSFEENKNNKKGCRAEGGVTLTKLHLPVHRNQVEMITQETNPVY